MATQFAKSLSRKGWQLCLGAAITCAVIVVFLRPAGNKLSDSNFEVIGSATSAQAKPDLMAVGIVPDVLSTFVQGQEALQVQFGQVTVQDGDDLQPAQAAAAPVIHVAAGSPGQLYTLVMVDPDPPSPDDPKYREWLHWIVVNMDENGNGDEVAPYTGPTPPAGRHRYVLLLFKQLGTERMEVDAWGSRPRASFKVERWASEIGLEGPMAARYFYSQPGTA